MNTTRWEQLLRYRFIEIIALWEGRLTTKHLCEVFGIGRQQASKDINNYKRSIGPGNLEYDGTAKGYRPSATFTPSVTQGKPRSISTFWLAAARCSKFSGSYPTPHCNRSPLRADAANSAVHSATADSRGEGSPQGRGRLRFAEST